MTIAVFWCVTIEVFWCVNIAVFWYVTFAVFWCVTIAVFWYVTFAVFWCVTIPGSKFVADVSEKVNLQSTKITFFVLPVPKTETEIPSDK